MVTDYAGAGISDPEGIAAGPGHTLWFTNYYGNSIGRITTAGVVATFNGPNIRFPAWIAASPDHGLWFTDGGNDSIGRISP